MRCRPWRFEFLTPDDDTVDAATQARLCRMLAQAAGFQGMAGGQAIDLASVGMPLTSEQLHEMHRLKTGALLQASVMMGASCGTPSLQVQHALRDYGAAVGLAFQVVDDILDVTADSATLGKNGGQGRRAGQAHLCLADGAGCLKGLCAGTAGARPGQS